MALCDTTRSSPDLSKQAEIDLFPKLTAGKEKEFLQEVRDFVFKHHGSQIELKHLQEKVSLKVGILEETSYSNQAEMLEEWEQFYLPDQMFMEVIGVLQKFPCSCPNNELVLMVCEDGKLFAFEDNRLHLASKSLQDLFKFGLKFPGTEQYYRGQSFEDMTAKDWDEARASEEVQAKGKEHKIMLERMKQSFLENLDIIMGRKLAAGACDI